MKPLHPSVRPLLVALLALALAVGIAWSAWNVARLNHAGQLAPQHHVRDLPSLLLMHSTSTAVNDIQPWMTFDYLNKTFGLPDAYLHDALSVTDARYPKISLHRAAEHDGRDPNTFVESVKQAIRTHIAP